MIKIIKEIMYSLPAEMPGGGYFAFYGLRESLCLGFGRVCGKLEKDRSRYCGNEVGYDSDIDR